MGKEIPKSEHSPKFSSEIPLESKPGPPECEGTTPLADEESSPPPAFNSEMPKAEYNPNARPSEELGKTRNFR
jgi:hypothetical protein